VKPFKKILVPVDFSRHSAVAVQYASDLSRHYGASLTLVHIYQPFAYILLETYLPYTAEQLGIISSEFQKQLDVAQADARAAGAVSVETRVLQGEAPLEIVSFAEQHAQDLIVMGTHGRTGLNRVLLGSVAEKVVRSAPCPVLTVRTEAERPLPRAT
jgi:nucleotide-binding universal stress UspA family protein